MVGRNVAPNLTGMFAEINKAIAGDQTGAKYIDTFRRSMAPTIDPNSSESLQNYANYAQRNNYTDEANQYQRLALAQKQVEREDSQKKAKSAAQLSVARLLSDAQRVATNSAMPTSERQRRIRELSGEAQQLAAGANLDARTVLTPINQLLNYVTETEKKGQAASIQADASSLRNDIATAIANNDTDTAMRLMQDYQGVVERANAHGSADLVKDINTGLTTLIGKLPDAKARKQKSNAARALELTDTGGSQNQIDALLSDAETKVEFDKMVAQREADQLEIENAEQRLVNARLEAAEKQASAADRAAKGAKLNSADLEFLTKAERDQYIQQWENLGAYPSRRIQHNEQALARNKEAQERKKKYLTGVATAFVDRMPMVIAEMEESTDFSYDLDDWAEMTADPNGIDRWKRHSEVIAKLVAEDPRFIGGTEQERMEVAKEITIRHMNGVSKKFKTAWSKNEKARKTRENAESVRAEERAGDWVKGKSPEKNKRAVDAAYKEFSARSLEMGVSPITKEDWIEQVWKPRYHYPTTDAANATTRGVRGSKVETDLATTLFGDRQSGMQAERQPVRSDGGPSLPQRQRDNLSPPIGPMGSPDDYQTKLRKAREAQPNSPYPPLPEAADPYIDPRYRKLGGG